MIKNITYYIINRKGYGRVQSRMDNFSRHYLLKTPRDVAVDMNTLIIGTAEPRRNIEKHMKFAHREYSSDCDIR